MKLAIQMQANGEDIRVSMSGILDETCELPEFATPVTGRLIIDLEKLAMINSLGCRKWVLWIKAVKAKQGITLAKCSPAVVNQMNILSGFLPDNVTVESLFVPYHCEACADERFILFHIEQANSAEQIANWPEKLDCPQCKSRMELDVLKARYFVFATRKTA